MSTLVWPSPRNSSGSGNGSNGSAGEVAVASSSMSSTSAGHAGGMGMVQQHQQSGNLGGNARHQVAFGHNASPFMMMHQQQNHGQHDGSAHGPRAASSQGGSSSNSSFGFGFAAPSASASTSTGFGWNMAMRSPPPASGSGTASPSATTAAGSSNNRRRRRRSDSSEEMRGISEGNSVDDTEGEPSGHGKRMRREIRPVKSMANIHQSHLQQQQQPSPISHPNTEVDVGKALAGLSKPALLSVFTSLLSSHPSLKPVVLALLPAPSLDTFASSLHQLERKVLDALPVGQNLRQEYVYTRIRAPLEEYVAEARLALGQFCSPSSSSSPLHQQQHQQQDDPATIFAFLNILTLSVRKLEAILPRAPLPFSSTSSQAVQASVNNPSTLNHRDPLISFLPPLFNQWHLHITRLGALVNQQGRVLGAEMLRGWFRNLDSLVNPPLPLGFAQAQQGGNYREDAGNVGRKAAEAVRERFARELGWLVGVRATPPPSQNLSQNQSQSAASLSNQMDSKMMMADTGEDTDEEL